jgi:hypothetical protein
VQGSCHVDPVLRGLEFNGFTGKDCELFWSTGVYEIPNSKHQITNKSQIPILVIVICLIFDICDLEFLVPPADCRKRGKTIEAPSGISPEPGPSPHTGIFDRFQLFLFFFPDT